MPTKLPPALPKLRDLSKMTKKAARIAICKDVLQQLRLKRINPGLSYVSYVPAPWSWTDAKQDARDGMAFACESGCMTCALGSMMISHVRLFDNFTKGQFFRLEQNDCLDCLGQYFDEDQLLDIESAYMLWDRNEHMETLAAYRFGRSIAPAKVDGKSKRLRAIMMNIIKNDGTFKPRLGLKKVAAK